ncbi:MAG: TlpA disulfide reductase family protein [Pseudoxanthomonas suwonensis]|nr:TlpA disulfide reductase family protein [Pseudoxanthomonas suwonensis]
MLQDGMRASAPPPPEGLAIARRGERIPELTLPRLDGGGMTLPGDTLGRPLLVNFWASWCAPCIKEMPELQRFARSQDASGVQVLGIALDEEAAVRDFLQRVPVDYPILMDTPGPRDASVQLGNPRGALPFTVLLDAEGRLLKQRLGPFADGEIDGWVADH